MNEDSIQSIFQLGDFFQLAQKTGRKSITDGRGIAFGWSAVPVIIAGPDGEIDYEIEFNEKLDCIQLIPKFNGEIEVAGQVIGYAK